MRICDRCNREVTPDCWTARNFAKTWVLPKDVTLVDADYQFAEAYAAWLGAPDVARFNDDDIRREGLPDDVFKLLHDLAYHRYGRHIYSYVSQAQEILRGAEPAATTETASENTHKDSACPECSRLASRVEELAKKWKAAAMADVPPSYADRDLHHKYLKLDNYASGQDDCADELLELLAGAHAEEKE